MEEKNVFGQTIKDGQVVEPTPPEVEKKPEDKQTEKPTEDIEKNPLVVELRKQIADIKKEYGGNLSGQRDKIARLEGKLAELEKGTKQDEKPKPVFDKIVFSKDLPKDERDAMSDRERELHDELMTTRQKINEMAAQGASKAAQDDAGKKAAESAFDVAKAVQDEAMKLAEGNWTKAQQLIERFNTLGFDLTQVTAENVAERLQSVATLIPDFKPKKEQETANGGAVKSTEATTSGVDSIVAAAAAERSASRGGNYDL